MARYTRYTSRTLWPMLWRMVSFDRSEKGDDPTNASHANTPTDQRSAVMSYEGRRMSRWHVGDRLGKASRISGGMYSRVPRRVVGRSNVESMARPRSASIMEL